MIEISNKQDLTLDSALDEYTRLQGMLGATEFPNGATGWSRSVISHVNDRMEQLRVIIVNAVLFNRKEM